jgi:ABC-type Mn2+/Zn2+ transport system ATPase subunit
MSHKLHLEDVTVSYNRITAVHHLNATLSCGSCVALLGPNGAGKTTLLKAIAGLLPLETGRIEFRGHQLESTSGREIAYVPQREAVDWDFPITVRGLVEMGRYPALGKWRRFGAEDEAAVEEALHICDLEDIADRQISALSGGQQQRLCIARAIATEPEVILMDEPCSALDPISTLKVEETIHELKRSYTIVIVTHNMQQAVRVADMTAFYNAEAVEGGSGKIGYLVEFSPTEKIFNAPEQKATLDYVSGKFG